jgi:hypothetical protein
VVADGLKRRVSASTGFKVTSRCTASKGRLTSAACKQHRCEQAFCIGVQPDRTYIASRCGQQTYHCASLHLCSLLQQLNVMSRPPSALQRVLVSNDDGIEAPGIVALVQALHRVRARGAVLVELRALLNTTALHAHRLQTHAASRRQLDVTTHTKCLCTSLSSASRCLMRA